VEQKKPKVHKIRKKLNGKISGWLTFSEFLKIYEANYSYKLDKELLKDIYKKAEVNALSQEQKALFWNAAIIKYHRSPETLKLIQKLNKGVKLLDRSKELRQFL